MTKPRAALLLAMAFMAARSGPNDTDGGGGAGGGRTTSPVPTGPTAQVAVAGEVSASFVAAVACSRVQDDYSVSVEATALTMEARLSWYRLPVADQEYPLDDFSSAPDVQYGQEGERTWPLHDPLTVTLTSLEPCHGTIVAGLAEHDALTDLGEGGPISMTVTC